MWLCVVKPGKLMWIELYLTISRWVLNVDLCGVCGGRAPQERCWRTLGCSAGSRTIATCWTPGCFGINGLNLTFIGANWIPAQNHLHRLESSCFFFLAVVRSWLWMHDIITDTFVSFSISDFYVLIWLGNVVYIYIYIYKKGFLKYC